MKINEKQQSIIQIKVGERGTLNGLMTLIFLMLSKVIKWKKKKQIFLGCDFYILKNEKKKFEWNCCTIIKHNLLRNYVNIKKKNAVKQLSGENIKKKRSIIQAYVVLIL